MNVKSGFVVSVALISMSVFALLFSPVSAGASLPYPWLANGPTRPTLVDRAPVPTGFTRLNLEDASFAQWLRFLPVKPGHPKVLLFNGKKKGRQDVHKAVLDLDVGTRDLQQCADTIIRLRAEYLWAKGKRDQIHFKFTSGDVARYKDWRQGIRPRVNGNKVTWAKTAQPQNNRTVFKSYLKTVFTYAGTHSLQKELKQVANPAEILPGDVLIQGGFPGHAMVVVDVAIHKETKQRAFLLVQGYMPAQQAHLLKNLKTPSRSPWFTWSRGVLVTPEWSFSPQDHYRFSSP